MDPDKAIEVYERLRKAATANVVASGLEHLSYELCDWKVIRNPGTCSVDLHISYSLNNSIQTLTISWRELELHVRGETQVIQMSRTIAQKIRERIAEHVAERMGESVFRQCASQLVRAK